MKKHIKNIKKYLIPSIIILAAGVLYFQYKRSHCSPCQEQGITIKKGKMPYSQEIHRDALRAKQALAAFKATGFMPRIS